MRAVSVVLFVAVCVGAGAGCSSTRPQPQPREHLLKIYFANHSREALDMKTVAGAPPPFLLYSVERRVNTATPEQTALEQLLIGPNGREMSEGYTSLLGGLRLKSFSVKGNTAYVDLEGSPKLTGLLAAPRMRAQVEQTLKEFPTIEVVELWIDSRKDFDSLK